MINSKEARKGETEKQKRKTQQVKNKLQDDKLNPKSSIITLKANVLQTPNKGRNFRPGKENKTQLSVVYKRYTVNIKTLISWK